MFHWVLQIYRYINPQFNSDLICQPTRSQRRLDCSIFKPIYDIQLKYEGDTQSNSGNLEGFKTSILEPQYIEI